MQYFYLHKAACPDSRPIWHS